MFVIRAQRVIGGREQKLRTASDRVEFPDRKPVAVDEIMIQHVIFLPCQSKLTGILNRAAFPPQFGRNFMV